MKKQLFISRQLRRASPLQQLRSLYRIQDESLLEFQAVPIGDEWESATWLFFYSQRGVEYFANEAARLPHQKLAAIGPKTAQTIQTHLGRPADLVGNGDGGETAQQLLRSVDGSQQVAFCRAANSQESVQAYLPGQQVIDVICYQNQPRQDIDLLHCDVVLLTSPINAELWVTHYPDDIDDVTVIAIGSTTGKTLTDLGVTHYVSKSPSEEGLLATVNSIS